MLRKWDASFIQNHKVLWLKIKGVTSQLLGSNCFFGNCGDAREGTSVGGVLGYNHTEFRLTCKGTCNLNWIYVFSQI